MKWTQQEAIDFESACEVIGHLIGIKVEQIEAELNSANPSQLRIDAMRLRVSAMTFMYRKRKRSATSDASTVP